MVEVTLMRSWPSFGEGTGRVSETTAFPISLTKSAFCILLLPLGTSGDCGVVLLEFMELNAVGANKVAL